MHDTLRSLSVDGTIRIGDTFTLFDLSGGTTITGTYDTLSLPSGPGAWNTSNLTVDGTITADGEDVPYPSNHRGGFGGGDLGPARGRSGRGVAGPGAGA